MKKVLFVCSFLLAIVLTGCSKKDVLDCNQSLTTGGFKQDINMHAEYDKEDLVYYALRYDMDLSSYGETEIAQVNSQDMCAMVKAGMSSYSNALTNCKQKIEDKHLVITADYDLDVLKGMSTKKVTIAELKSELEKQNYSCIIK